MSALPLIGALLLAAAPAHAFRVTTWNLLDYPAFNLAGRQPNFRTVMAALPTDVLIVQELHSAAGADSFLYNVLRVAQPTRPWLRSDYLDATESVIYYDSLSVASVSNLGAISDGGPRQVLLALIKPRGDLSSPGWFRIYSMHLKAGDGSVTASDSATRTVECTNLRTVLNNTVTTNVGPNFILGGDTNFYGAFESGYTRLTESQTNNKGRSKDVLTMPGSWHVVPAYGAYDTQCPCATNCGAEFSGGGLDDRFDIVFTSYSLQDSVGFDVVGYTAFGNDGNHFNTDVNGSGFNTAVGLAVANALHDASDHLPVVMTLQLPAKVAAVSHLEFGTVITGFAAQQTLTVADGPPSLPAAALHYSLSAPAGFGAPAGTFTATAGAAGNAHVLTMSTASAGVKSGSLTIVSDDPDSASRPVLLGGTVLRHASASLDSATVVTESTLDLGTHTPAGWVDPAVAVFDRGYDALQARLAVQSADISGGAGRFTFAPAFAPMLVGSPGARFGIHFDASGATDDSTYTATLTFHTADEALPGAQPGSDLVVHLAATPTHTTDTPPAAGALRFDPPRPNPFGTSTRFAFELPSAAPVELVVFDAGGRRLTTLASGTWAAGRHVLAWDGLDAHGHTMGAGLYFARFSTAGLDRTVRIVRLP